MQPLADCQTWQFAMFIHIRDTFREVPSMVIIDDETTRAKISSDIDLHAKYA